MDVLTRLNGVIEYIESHLLDEGPLSAEEVARQALMPPAQFFRLFPYIAGVSVYEYIRRRRLTLAAQELLSTDIKVVDVALKYGYESPDAFGRAFLQMHGVPPSGIRKPGVRIVAFPRLRFTIQIKGDVHMNYQLKEKAAFTIMGKKITMTQADTEKNLIKKFWDESMRDGWFNELCRLCRTELGVMGACASLSSDGTFDYYIAIEKLAGMDTNGYEVLEVPASTWACFESIGPMPNAIQEVWKYVMTEWLPSSGYRHAGTPDLEVYSAGDNSAPDYRSYVWIPLVKE